MIDRTKVFDTLRCILISGEMLGIAAVAALATLRPQLVITIGDYFRAAELPAALTILGAPLALLAATYHLSLKILHPEGKRAVLLGWPEYWRLQIRIKVALIFGIMGSIASAVGWLALKAALLIGTSLWIVGLTVSSIALLSVANANMDIRDILEGH